METKTNAKWKNKETEELSTMIRSGLNAVDFHLSQLPYLKSSLDYDVVSISRTAQIKIPCFVLADGRKEKKKKKKTSCTAATITDGVYV